MTTNTVQDLETALDTRFPDVGDRGATGAIVRSPGRVNLIGEHTDYNEGLVMPAAIDREIRVAWVPTDDRRVEIELLATGERAGFDLDAIRPAGGAWIDYVAGVAWALSVAGVETHGFRAVLASDLPAGAGLSSSAALELAAAWALSNGRPSMPPMDLARLAQRAENEYVGVRCGLMDQFSVVHGIAGSALRLDCRSLDWRPVRLPAGLALVVCHSGARHSLAGSAYNDRRADCERAVAQIADREGDAIRSLRDVDDAMLERNRDRLDDTAYRRARHIVDENARVMATEHAFETDDLNAIGRLFAASHASLRDLYEVSSDALDSLVEIASGVDGVVAARLTGAGFAGCTVNLVHPWAVAAFRAAVEREHPRRTGLTPLVLEVEATDGVGLATGQPNGAEPDR
jgi:galactokinase